MPFISVENSGDRIRKQLRCGLVLNNLQFQPTPGQPTVLPEALVRVHIVPGVARKPEILEAETEIEVASLPRVLVTPCVMMRSVIEGQRFAGSRVDAGCGWPRQKAARTNT